MSKLLRHTLRVSIVIAGHSSDVPMTLEYERNDLRSPSMTKAADIVTFKSLKYMGESVPVDLLSAEQMEAIALDLIE